MSIATIMNPNTGKIDKRYIPSGELLKQMDITLPKAFVAISAAAVQKFPTSIPGILTTNIPQLAYQTNASECAVLNLGSFTVPTEMLTADYIILKTTVKVGFAAALANAKFYWNIALYQTTGVVPTPKGLQVGDVDYINSAGGVLPIVFTLAGNSDNYDTAQGVQPFMFTFTTIVNGTSTQNAGCPIDYTLPINVSLLGACSIGVNQNLDLNAQTSVTFASKAV